MSPKKKSEEQIPKRRRLEKAEPAKEGEESGAADGEVPTGTEGSKLPAVSSKFPSPELPAALLKVKQEAAAERKDIQKMVAKLNYMKKTGNSTAYDEYHSKDFDDKKQWFLQVYKKDPRLSKYSCMQTERSAYKAEQVELQNMWLTEEQIMAQNGYLDRASPDYTAIKEALLEGLASRPHEIKKLADMGIKQYDYQTEKSSQVEGKKRTEKVIEEGEVEVGAAKKLGNFLLGAPLGLEKPEKQEPSVSIEKWKKDAMAFEKSLHAAEAKAHKLVQVANASKFKLETVQSKMSTAHVDNIDEKLPLFMNAITAFQKAISTLDSKNQENAHNEFALGEPAMATLKEHMVNFEKVLKLATDYIKSV